MDQNDYQLFRGYVSDLVRRSLTDGHVSGGFPAPLATAFETSPEKIISDVVDVLLPGVLRAQGLPLTQSERQDLNQSALRAARQPATANALAFMARNNTRELTTDKQLADGALLFCARGRKLLKNERYSEARAVFKRAIEIKHDAKPAWLGLAEALEKLGEDDQAKEARKCADRL